MSNLNLTVSASEHTRFDHHYHPPAGQPSGQAFDLSEPCPCPGGTQCDCAVLA